MMLGERRTPGGLAAAVLLPLLLLVLVLAGCGGDDDGGGAAGVSDTSAAPEPSDGTAATATTDGTASAALPSETGPIGEAPDGGTPVQGGVLRVMVGPSDPGGLDPVRQLGSGHTGLNELTAIYDSLMRYDPVTQEYVPQLAESLTANADNSVYTLTLRPDVTFSDGTPLDSAAVTSGFERFSGPSSLFVYYAVFPQIVSMETPDPLTVVITLDGPDPSFPFLLTQSFGLVPSPTALQEMGDEAFNLDPVGAGPFTVKEYQPGVSLTLERNEDYWGEAPYLDEIQFTWVADEGARVEALASGDVDVINLTSPVEGAAAFEAGHSGFGWLNYGSPVVSMNMREGYPFADERLRRAVALALDPETVDERAFEGLGYPSKVLFPVGALASGAEGIPTDVDAARALVQEVKDDTGFDGSFVLLSAPEPSVQAAALSIQAMLNNVGFDAVVESPPDWTTAVYTNFDFDAVVTSTGMVETDPYVFLVYEAGGDFSPTSLTDPALDEAIIELRAAASEAETRAATAKIQEIWNEIVPSVWLGHRVDRMFQSSRVHGLVHSASVVAHFHEAWLSD